MCSRTTTRSHTLGTPVTVSHVAMLTLLLLVTFRAPALAGEAPELGTHAPGETIVGLTSPSSLVTLASIHQGRIANLAVPEGGTVQKGDLVFALDDRVQRARVDIARARAKSTLEIDLAAARWDQAKRELDRLANLYGDSSASSKELSDARANADIAHLEYEVTRFDHEQDIRAHQRERWFLKQFRAQAPFTGYVAQHLKHVGDTVDETEGIVRLAQLDPLRVSVDCPLSLAPSVRKGDQVRVRPVDPQWGPRLATVTFASRVADGASQTFKVKLSVDNADAGWVSGLKVVVELPGVESLPEESISLSSRHDDSTDPDGRSK